MLDQALGAVAAAGGAAVVQAAGTDVWAGLRQAVARWFGRGDERRERAELERLDRAADDLEAAEGAAAERMRLRQEAAWQARIEALLESLDASERGRAAEELSALLARHTVHGGASAGDGGQAVAGDVRIEAAHGSAAAWSMGNVSLGNPPQPGPRQG